MNATLDTTNTFQKSFTRLLVGAALVSLGLTLLYQAQHAWALFELTQSGVRTAMRWGTSVIRTVYAGSAALNGLVLVLLVGTAHALFWSRAKWDGKNFAVPEKTSQPRMSEVMAWVGVLGYLFLVGSICEYAESRSSLDSALGLVMLAVLLNILSHKIRMAQIVSRHAGGLWASSREAMLRGTGSAMAAFAAMFLVNALCPHMTWEFPMLGLGYYALTYKLLKYFRLPDVGRSCGPDENFYKEA